MSRRSSIKSTPDKRYRFAVPIDDEITQLWLAHQHNLSMSMRMLIRNEIDRNGMKDIFATTCDEFKLPAKDVSKEPSLHFEPIAPKEQEPIVQEGILQEPIMQETVQEPIMQETVQEPVPQEVIQEAPVMLPSTDASLQSKQDAQSKLARMQGLLNL